MWLCKDVAERPNGMAADGLLQQTLTTPAALRMRCLPAELMAQHGTFLVPTLVTYQQLLAGGAAAGMAPALVAKVGGLVQQVCCTGGRFTCPTLGVAGLLVFGFVVALFCGSGKRAQAMLPCVLPCMCRGWSRWRWLAAMASPCATDQICWGICTRRS